MADATPAEPRFRQVLIVCPAQARTGGPEALHQLGRALLDLGHDAAMVYTSSDQWLSFRAGVAHLPTLPSPMPPDYARYAVPWATAIPDAADVAVVFPEIWPGLASRFERAVPYLWWLSVDHGLAALAQAGGIGALARTACRHLAQSEYARAWLAARGVAAAMLSDYTTPAMAATTAEELARPRAARILYPARGRDFAHALRRWTPGVEWREIAGMDAATVRETFLGAALYADFGSHPGKDRMPREAAALGCCVATGRRGAAGNAVDIPIPDRYKFREAWYRAPFIARALARIVAKHAARRQDFATYRAAIAGEREAFAGEVEAVFGAGRRAACG